MKTKWKDWWAGFGEITAKYEVKRDWAEEEEIRLNFKLQIYLDGNDYFFARVMDWTGNEIVGLKKFGSLEEAIDYLSDVDCEKYVDEHREGLQKLI